MCQSAAEYSPPVFIKVLYGGIFRLINRACTKPLYCTSHILLQNIWVQKNSNLGKWGEWRRSILENQYRWRFQRLFSQRWTAQLRYEIHSRHCERKAWQSKLRIWLFPPPSNWWWLHRGGANLGYVQDLFYGPLPCMHNKN